MIAYTSTVIAILLSQYVLSLPSSLRGIANLGTMSEDWRLGTYSGQRLAIALSSRALGRPSGSARLRIEEAFITGLDLVNIRHMIKIAV